MELALNQQVPGSSPGRRTNRRATGAPRLIRDFGANWVSKPGADSPQASKRLLAPLQHQAAA